MQAKNPVRELEIYSKTKKHHFNLKYRNPPCENFSK